MNSRKHTPKHILFTQTSKNRLYKNAFRRKFLIVLSLGRLYFGYDGGEETFNNFVATYHQQRSLPQHQPNCSLTKATETKFLFCIVNVQEA